MIFVATTLEADLGGIARSVPALAGAAASGAARLGAQGARVVLLAPRPRRSTLERMALPQALELRLCDSRARLRRELERLTSNPGAVRFLSHAGVWDPLSHFVARLGRRRGIPVITSTRSMLDPWALGHRKWKKRLAWWAYARRDLLGAVAIHATAELEGGYVRATLGPKCPPVIVVPNGVELPASRPLTDEGGRPAAAAFAHEGATRSRHDPARRPRTLLFLSRIHQKKGVLDLVRAFGALDPDGWELVIAGNDDGGPQRLCEQLAEAQQNSGRIRFYGPVSDADKWALYGSADLFVLPSYSENFGIVVGEALGMGVPVMTTTATPWGEYARAKTQREKGTKEDLGLWVVEPGQHPLMSAMEEALALSDEERAERGAKGAEWIRREFTWEAVGRRFLVEVVKVLKDRRTDG